MRVPRRGFLAALGPTLAAVAGCVGGTDSPAGGSTTGPDGSGPDQTTTPTASPPTTASSLPAPDPASDVFDGYDCPSFEEHADRTVCYHEVDPNAADVVLGVDPEVFDPKQREDAAGSLRFTLYNRSTWHFQFNPYDWGIERREDGQWAHVAPDAVPEPLLALPPGRTFTWEFPTELHPTPSPDRYMLLPKALTPGVYAFHVAGSFGRNFEATETATPTAGPPKGRIECVGLARLNETLETSNRGTTTDASPENGTTTGG